MEKQPVNYRDSFRFEDFRDPTTAVAFQCKLCKRIPIPDNALNHAKCGSMYCKPCYASLKFPKQCPSCHGQAQLTFTKTDNRLLYQLHQLLVLKCPSEGQCEWVGPIEGLAFHRTNCAYAIVECQYAVVGCSFEGNKAAQTVHEAKEKDLHLSLCMKLIKEKGVKYEPPLLPQKAPTGSSAAAKEEDEDIGALGGLFD